MCIYQKEKTKTDENHLVFYFPLTVDQQKLAPLFKFDFQPGGLCADALVLIHHREVHVGHSHLCGHLHFKLQVETEYKAET